MFDALKALVDRSTPVAVLGFREAAALLRHSIRILTVPVTLWNCLEKGGCIANVAAYAKQYDVSFPRSGFVFVPFLKPQSSQILGKAVAQS